MKILNIVFVAIVMNSCASEGELDENGTRNPGTKALMTVELLEGGGEDLLNSVRFFVFDNASTSHPTLDMNRLIQVEEGSKEAVKFNVTLEVSRNPDKMVVVIVNEPVQMSGTLEGINHPDALEDLSLSFAQILNANHTSLLATGIPMTGVAWAGADHGRPVYDSQAEAETDANRLKMVIERAVARVDFRLEVTEEEAMTGYLAGQTKVTLANTYGQSYFVMGNEENGTRNNPTVPSRNFGFLQTVDPSEFTDPGKTRKTWDATVDEWLLYDPDPGAVNTLYVCSFYTPERTSSAAGDADKLVLILEGIVKENTTTGGTFVISTLQNENNPTPQPFTEVLRNNVYQITGRVSKKGLEFTAQVLNWHDANIEVDIEKDAYLTVSEHDILIRNIAGTNTAAWTLKTNVPDGWSAKLYTDKACTNLMTDGWLTLDRTSGATTMDGTRITATLSDRKTREGYAKFTAGRISLVVKVARRPIVFEFARSNVLSLNNGSTLVFAESEEDHKPESEGGKGILGNMQGIMFKWGSLVGVGSLGAENVRAGIWFNQSNVSPGTWDGIPYGNASFFNYTGSESTDAFATYNNNTGFNAVSGVGDLCRYISSRNWVEGKWRMPTCEELGLLLGETLNGGARHGVWSPAEVESITESYGVHRILSGYWYGAGVTLSTNDPANVGANRLSPPYGTLFIPASGWRDATLGTSKGMGHFGGFWSTVPRFSGASNAWHLRFDEQERNEYNYSGPRSVGLPIRCIRAE